MKTYFEVVYKTTNGNLASITDGIWERLEEAELHCKMRQKTSSLDYFVAELHVPADEQEVF